MLKYVNSFIEDEGDHMGINVGLALSQAAKLREQADALLGIKTSLLHVKSSLNSSWQAEEMVYIQRALDSINQEIGALSSELDSLSSTIQATAYEIKREEEAAEAAAKAKAEAAAKAARERQLAP
jgi:uncharacterized protein YukE